MKVDLFDFDLPDDRIALRPAEPRDSARLLHVPAGEGAFADRHVRDLPDILTAGDIIVVNDTRVIPARLDGTRRRGDAIARMEVMLHKREGLSRWRAFVRPAKKLKKGERISFGQSDESADDLMNQLHADVAEKGEGGEILLDFSLSGPALDEAIVKFGHMPLPPYIAGKRVEDSKDSADYQTVFANEPGAVAAPTAGLHYTPELVARLEAKGIRIVRVTLHVGAGTFLPVKADDTNDHKMHAEFGTITPDVAQALNEARSKGGRIVATGTTSLRILETATDDKGIVHPFSGDTSIFITPGYRFKAIDLLLTNFHLPRSTLFMLVSAFSGLGRMQATYAHAIAQNYRFYSYGDACLLERVAP
jgi:S-adenosylmethionine:tRNA ribosyltransferase-isomerase